MDIAVFFSSCLIKSIISLPKLSYINFQVLILMFNLMMVISAFKRLKLIDKIAVEILTKHKSLRMVSLILTSLWLTNTTNIYFSSIFLSQVVRNLPCAILLSKFTNSWSGILIGVNIGGTGTIIASLASLISYKFYAKKYNGRKYLIKFTISNFVSLIVFTAIFYIFQLF